LQARCEGDDPVRLRLTINNQFVSAVEDPGGYSSGPVGLRAQAGADKTVKIRFDDFRRVPL
jgi:hypothetical protein